MSDITEGRGGSRADGPLLRGYDKSLASRFDVSVIDCRESLGTLKLLAFGHDGGMFAMELPEADARTLRDLLTRELDGR